MERASSSHDFFNSENTPETRDDTPPIIEISRNRIGLDIPLELRIAHVHPSDMSDEWLSSLNLAERLGTYDRRVHRMVNELGIEPETRTIDGLIASVYPTFTLPVLREEFVWRDTYRALPSRLRTNQIAELLGRSPGNTYKRLRAMDIESFRGALPNGIPYTSYPKRALRILKQEDMSIAPAHDWLLVSQLRDTVDAEWTWIVRRLEENGITPERRRSALSGKVLDHYPPQSLELLQTAMENRPKYGSAWLTKSGLMKALGRSQPWIERRLDAFDKFAEDRQDDQGRTRTHYAPFVLRQLQKVSDTQSATEASGDRLSLTGVSRALGHTSIWAATRLDALGITAEMTRDKTGRLWPTYPYDVVDRITRYEEANAEEELKSGPDLTALMFGVASLRSRIAAQKGLLKAQRELGLRQNFEQTAEINETLAILRKKLQAEQRRWYKARNNVTDES